MMDVIQKPAAAGYDAPPYLRRSGGGEGDKRAYEGRGLWGPWGEANSAPGWRGYERVSKEEQRMQEREEGRLTGRPRCVTTGEGEEGTS